MTEKFLSVETWLIAPKFLSEGAGDEKGERRRRGRGRGERIQCSVFGVYCYVLGTTSSAFMSQLS